MRAVITGATSGIGRQFAIELASRGYDLLIAGRREEMLRELADDIRTTHKVKVTVVAGDLAEQITQDRLIDAIESGPVSFLVNNAGSGQGTDFRDAASERLAALNALLAEAPTRLMRAALPGMIHAGHGTIINVGSLAGRAAVPGSSIYVAAKSYLERLSETLALELGPKGIVVQALLPGYVRTDFHRAVPNYREKQRSRGLIRWAEPDDVVRVSLAAADRARRRPAAPPRHRDVVVVPGRLNRFLLKLSGMLPRRLIYRAAMRRKRLE